MATESKQKDVFLQSEADAWYERNKEALARQDFSGDAICKAVADIAASGDAGAAPLSLLEVGCGEGRRLSWLAANLGIDAHGLEPSAKAVAQANARDVAAVRGTADALPYPERKFDVLVFGFCLYLCDPEDLFRIAAEADRVLKPEAWLVVHDFHSTGFTRREYHHAAGVYSNKMDFRKLFDWHPSYSVYSHRLSAHGTSGFSDDPQEWVATSVLRKRALAPRP